MRHLIVSDVHANAPALAAVLADAERRSYDGVVFLGDLVGYYPYPSEAIAMMRDLSPAVALQGNHDALLLAFVDGDTGTAHREDSLVSELVSRQLDVLRGDDIAYLRGLEASAIAETWQAAHGAFRSQFEYLSTLHNAQGNLPYLQRPVGIVGHTHVPRAFAWIAGGEGDMWRTVSFRGAHAQYRLPPRARAFLNPGAVGQPRDGSPAAAYAIFDDERAVFDVYRVDYDLGAVQQRIAEAGYPTSLATRLAAGR